MKALYHLAALALAAAALTACGGSADEQESDATVDAYGNVLVKSQDEQYLEDNAKKADVTVTASGLQYRVIKQGDGAKPGPTDRVKVHYTGRLVNGKVFDSSEERGEPATFGVNQVIKGWTEALQMMPVGSEWELVIPADIAYGKNGQGPIPANSTLIFNVKLLDIEK